MDKNGHIGANGGAPRSLAELLSPQQEDQLILVDLLDREVGTMGKLECHQEGRLHRAFSLFLYREAGGGRGGEGHGGEAHRLSDAGASAVDGRAGGLQILVQRRAEGKYHSGGLLTNSVCSHPRAGESLAEAVPRRLSQELGVRADVARGLPLREVGAFVYRNAFESGLTEFEYDHVFVAPFDGAVDPDPEEVSAVGWVDADELLADLETHPSRYTCWFMTAAPMAIGWLRRELR